MVLVERCEELMLIADGLNRFEVCQIVRWKFIGLEEW